ncbi:hypothetical protein ACT35X_002863 [Enterobacter hormaechei]
MKGYISTNRLFAFTALFALTFLMFVMRRPELITNAQFWAEDGRYWYHQAYMLGPLQSIILPQNGYYQSISKITASLSLALPLASAPLFFNVTAISIRCFVVMYLLSSRMSEFKLLPRFALAAFIIAMPHLSEVHANITNAHWYLSMWLFMILISTRPDGNYWKIHDYTVLLLSGLSGPFIVFLAPVVFLKLVDGDIFRNPLSTLKSAFRKIDTFTAIFAIVCLIQIVAILASSTAGRSHAPLGASLELLIKILSSKVFIGSFIPRDLTIDIWNAGFINYIIVAMCFFVITIVALKGTWKQWSMIIFPVLMLGFALAKPMISNNEPQWPIIMTGGAERYFVIPNVFWVAILLTFIGMAGNASKYLTMMFIVGIVYMSYFTYRIQPLRDNGWAKSVYLFDEASPGQQVNLPINPGSWEMILIKK